MEKEPKMGIDPKIKEEINKEGWEKTDDRDEAAVIIGPDWKKAKTPEEAEQFRKEVERLKEKLEREGKADDLGTYIRMHKEIKLPKKEASSDISDVLTENKGLLWNVTEKVGGEEYKYLFPESLVYNYIDKDGNVASFNLDPQKLTPTREIIERKKTDNSSKEAFYEIIRESVKELGFNWGSQSTELITAIHEQILDYQKRLKEEVRKRKKEEFDF